MWFASVYVLLHTKHLVLLGINSMLVIKYKVLMSQNVLTQTTRTRQINGITQDLVLRCNVKEFVPLTG